MGLEPSKAHLQHIEDVRNLLKEAGMRIVIIKCFFFCESIEDLGHGITPGKLLVTTKTAKSIKALQYLKAISKTRSPVGSCNIYWGFAPNSANLPSPLNKYRRKGDPLQFNLDEEEMKAQDVLKDKLITTPVLAFPLADRQCTFNSDDFDTQVECVLLRNRNGKVLAQTSH